MPACSMSSPILRTSSAETCECGGPTDLSSVDRTLRAHALATAESFSDLLCLATLVGVETLAYQIETVRRVMKVLRGRALLADEVGLGKTVEAIMILREYQLRSMAR